MNHDEIDSNSSDDYASSELHGNREKAVRSQGADPGTMKKLGEGSTHVDRELEHAKISSKMKTIIDDQDDYIQELENQVVKIHSHMQEMEGQVENLQDIIEFLLRKCNLGDEQKAEMLKERRMLGQHFKMQRNLESNEQLQLHK